MKKIVSLLIVCMVSSILLSAQDTININNPQLKIFLPKKGTSTGRAMLILPGGGYVGLAVNHEGYDWAEYFNAKGIATAVLSYTMPNGDRSLPFNDVEKAMKLIHQHADEWNIDKNDIGIMGSSAGGHLAATYATHCKPELAPAFQILFYPVITMDKRYTHIGSHDNLLGKNATKELEDKYSNEKQVTEKTSRAIILFADKDDVVPTENGVNYYLALTRHGVPATLHIYPSGGHGFGYNKSFPYHKEMLQNLSSWLHSF